MSPDPSSQEFVIDLIREELLRRTRRLTWIVLPVVAISILAALLILTNLTGGILQLSNPLAVGLSTALLTAAVVVGRWGYHAIERAVTERHPLVRLGPGALNRLVQATAVPTQREALAQAVKQELVSIFKPASIRLLLHDPHLKRYLRDGVTLGSPPDEALAQVIVQSVPYAPLSLDAPEQHPQPAPELQALRDEGAVLVIPMGLQGWMELGRPATAQSYDRAALTFLQQVGRILSAGCERIAIAESQQQRTHELRSLYRIAQSVTFGVETDDLLELIYTQMSRVMPLPGFFIALVNSDTHQLAFRFFVKDDERSAPDTAWPLNLGLGALVLAHGSTIRTLDYTQECERRGVAPFTPEASRAWMGTTLSASDRALGIMVAQAFEEGIGFTAEDEDFFTTVAAYTASLLERSVLYDRLETRAHQLSALNEIGQLLASSLQLNEVLALVVRSAASLFSSEAGSLLLLDEDSGDLVFRISSGPAGDKLIGMRIPAGKGIAGAAFAENRPVISQNIHQDERWYSDFDRRASFRTESVIAVPLNARGRTIGVLEVINRTDGQPFSQEDADLLLSFAAQAAIAIENARLFTMTDAALQARVEELTTLQYIDRRLNATLDYKEVMGQTLEWATNITEATLGMVAALQEQEDGGRGLSILASHGIDPTVLEPYSGERIWPLSQGLIGHTVRTGQTTVVEDAASDPHYVALVPGMRSQMVVPIKREERVIGAISLESDRPDTFGADRVAFIERLADHAAIAIDNARLFQQVQQANQAKTEFISFVSHELKQPMTSIKGYADLLAKGMVGLLNPQQQQFVGVIRANAGRMDRIVQDLLDISRIEAGRLKLELTQVVPEEIVSEAVQAYEQEIAAKAQQLLVEIEPQLPTVSGDRGRLIQVLTNLVSNANKYTPERGSISVRASRVTEAGQDYVRWSVADTGIGMTPEELQQLFTKYFRSKNTMVRSIQGTGLGLVITRSIVEMHGGRIQVESDAGKGSVFSFVIPVTS